MTVNAIKHAMTFSVLVAVATSSAAELRPEFVSLQQPARFEQGWLQYGDFRLPINKLEETTTSDGTPFYRAQMESMELFVYSDNENPSGRIVKLNTGLLTYVGEHLAERSSQSSVIADHEILDISGMLEASNGRQLQVNIRITESLMGGGSSELDIRDNNAFIRGDLGTRTYNQIFNMIRHNPSVRTLVLVEVSGSVNDEINMQTGRLIRSAGIHTHIPSGGEAYSGGIDLFCAGATRSLGAGAIVGVHSWSDDEGEAKEFPRGDPRHQEQVDYFREMLGSRGEEFYYFTIESACDDASVCKEDMHIMRPEEIQSYGLVTN